VLSASVACAHDWPQLLGPSRNGEYRGGDLADSWPESGPRLVWETKVGRGFSGPVISGERLVLFHRTGSEEIIDCLRAASGDKLWSFAYPTAYHDDFGFDDGPRSAPTVAAGRVFSFGAEGVLSCVDLESGRKLWLVETQKLFSVRKGFFGAACSPLVVGDRVLVNVGSRDGAGIVAFDGSSGKVLWKATSDEASYSSPVLARIGAEDHAFFFTRAGLTDIDPAAGRVRFSFPWRPRIQASVNAASPVVAGDVVFISTSYSKGAAALEVKGDSFRELWSGDEVLSNHYATSVHRDGFLYGFDGRQEYGARLRCVELRTGKARWSEEGFGCGSLILAGSRLLAMLDNGELVLGEVSPQAFKPLARARILGGTARAYPALAHGFFYARSEEKLVCIDLRRK
jgi:outer membrane protein assembly factor BamB